MTKGFKIVGVFVGVALVAAVALGALFVTQPAAAAAVGAAVGITSVNHGGANCGQAGLDAAAKALNMTSADLQTQLRGGATLSSLADKAKVKLADVLAAVDAACKTSTKAAIEAAVTAGALTRDKADWLEQGLDKGYWGPGSATTGGPNFGGFGGGPGFGFGFGRHGFGFGGGPGRGNHAEPNGTPQATPANTTTS